MNKPWEAGEPGASDAPPSLGGQPDPSAQAAPDEAEAAALTRDQRRWLKLQMEHLRLQMEGLREDRQLSHRHQGLKYFRDRLRIGLELLAVGGGVVILAAAAAIVWDASRSNSVVIDAFSSPPERVARGFSGEVVASKLLDELSMLQTQTRATEAKRGLKDAWSRDIKLEVPHTGMSIGEINRDLHAWLGHETHISGDLEETANGLSLTVRGPGVLGRTFTGSASDLQKLIAAAAEYVYGRSEPYLFATYLEGVGRDRDAVAFIPGVFQSARAEDRPYLFNAWGNGLSDLGLIGEALAKYREAVRLKADYWSAYNNVQAALWSLGDEEGVWRAGKAMERAAGGRPGRSPEANYVNVDELTWDLPRLRAEMLDDMRADGGAGTALTPDGLTLAQADAWMHNPAAAELDLQTTPQVDKDPLGIAATHLIHGYEALEAGDYVRARREMEAFGAEYANPVVMSTYPGSNCWVVPAEEMDGHPDKADAALAAGGRFVDCYRFRGDILDHRGDWPAAQRAYAAAVALAPDLPAADYSWGLALARHGDLEAAKVRFALAHARGPHWADPLKAWGDALAAQGRMGEAVAKYDEALRYAPAWAALRQARAAARRRKG